VKREDRAEALGALYAAEARGALPEAAGLSTSARKLAGGAWENHRDLDVEIAAAATGWRIERMPAVDRAVLRLALYELRHTGTPVAVVISEAVELAKQYSTVRSGAFVNGVLAKLAKAPPAGPTQ
jgi:N utilization substance protein B